MCSRFLAVTHFLLLLGPPLAVPLALLAVGAGNQISFLSLNELPKGNLKAAPEKVVHELQYSAFVTTILADRKRPSGVILRFVCVYCILGRLKRSHYSYTFFQ